MIITKDVKINIIYDAKVHIDCPVGLMAAGGY